MLILDESGNNLDGPNLTRVSTVLRQVAEAYGLTVVLACQDIYTDRVARHGAGMIQLLRPSRRTLKGATWRIECSAWVRSRRRMSAVAVPAGRKVPGRPFQSPGC
jgi:hypothetical protein